MKSKRISADSTLNKQTKKKRIQSGRKMPQKQFQLLYRQRDQTIGQSPMESIIFVKSKRCVPDQKFKKLKVKQEFKKIMKDLDMHLIENKKIQSSCKDDNKQLSQTKPSQLKSTTSFKKSLKQNDESLRTNKISDTYQNKKVRNVTSPTKNVFNEKKSMIHEHKSPKKQRKFTSPLRKNMTSPKSPKTKKSLKMIKKKLLNEVNKKKTINNQQKSLCNEVKQKGKKRVVYISEQKKVVLQKIPLAIQQYILMQDSFQYVQNPKTLNKFQTKLLSTYRACNKQNKLIDKLKAGIKQNQKLNQQFEAYQEERMGGFRFGVEDFQDEEDQSFNVNQGNIQAQFISTVVDQQLINKVKLIQKWWKAIFYAKLYQINQSNGRKLSFNQEMPNHSDIPSVQSIDLCNPMVDLRTSDSKIQQISIIQRKIRIAEQKKQTHKQILIKFFKQNKITQQCFDEKLIFINNEYNKQMIQIKNLQKILSDNTNLLKQAQDKIIQDRKLADNIDQDQSIIFTKIFGSSQIKSQQNIKSAQRIKSPQKTKSHNKNDIQVRQYRIGNKITQQMQDYIINRKKTVGCHEQSGISEKYKKITNSQGQQYYQDFESCSQQSENSPHKCLNPNQQSPEITFVSSPTFNEIIEQFKEQQQIKSEIDRKIAIQMGAIKAQTLNGQFAFDASIIGIHQFLIHFFKFYLYYYKDQFLRLINMPYGYQPEKRLKFMQGYQDETDQLEQDEDGIIYGLQFIISDDVLDQFFQQFYQNSFKTLSDEQKQFTQYVKIHSKSIFDCFNEALNNFRPYYGINGPPYIWNSTQKALTFYFISQQNIQQVFQKTQFQVLKWASALNGVMIDKYEISGGENNIEDKLRPFSKQLERLQDLITSYRSCAHPVLLESRQERLIKQQKVEIIQTISQWNYFEQQRTASLYQISSIILEQITLELLQQLEGF